MLGGHKSMLFVCVVKLPRTVIINDLAVYSIAQSGSPNNIVKANFQIQATLFILHCLISQHQLHNSPC